MKNKKISRKKNKYQIPLCPVVANKQGEIFELEDYGAAAMTGIKPVLVTYDKTVKMPHGSELMLLPHRKPIVFNFYKQKFEIIHKNPYDKNEEIYPVAIFNSPGYVNRYFCAYENKNKNNLLPLFSYGAVAWINGKFRSASICVDIENRQDIRLMPYKGIVLGIKKMRKKYPDNRLMRHLEKCALTHGCPAAKNFFLGRYEAPLPTSIVCNAQCLGCISLQTKNNLVACQERISFIPLSHEITEISLEHIIKVKKSIVSFGQGCEGEPLTAFHVIEPAIKAIRKETSLGTININTNASMPDYLEKLFDAGLDSMRVSMNSVRKACYISYFRPKTYKFQDVIKSIEIAGKKNKFISINYLNCPGITDSEYEFNALKFFLDKYPIKMIQWRNMNYDPLAYFETMEKVGGKSHTLGMMYIIKELKKLFPNLIHGYFNPPKENYLIEQTR
ncbi:MAG: radical SAM protein [Desulfobacteraceae bacterium 4572_130]|nr:MAG: radical SAM protein [Desulfobacteraceae bacterium 4572_130]